MAAVASRPLRRWRGWAADGSLGSGASSGGVLTDAPASPGRLMGLPKGLPMPARSGAVVMLVSKVSPAGLGGVCPAGCPVPLRMTADAFAC